METQKHFYTLLIWTVLITTGPAVAFSGSGFGTEANPYVITTINQLQEMRNDPNACYILGNDIDATETKYWNDEEGFEPIGTLSKESATAFTGSFDGKGYAISNLYINRINKDQQALFGVLIGAEVKNVNLTDADVTGNYNVGTLAAQALFESHILFCAATGKVTLKPGTGSSKSGGLIASVTTGSHIDMCFSDVDVNADTRKQVGGLIGYLRGRGYTPIAKLTNSFSYATVTGNGSKVANLVGDADGSHVDKCYSNGKGKALIGFNYRSPVITNCYWDKEVGAASSHYGGEPMTTELMTHKSTFVDWDFEEIWYIDEGVSYPYFKYWLE